MGWYGWFSRLSGLRSFSNVAGAPGQQARKGAPGVLLTMWAPCCGEALEMAPCRRSLPLAMLELDEPVTPDGFRQGANAGIPVQKHSREQTPKCPCPGGLLACVGLEDACQS